MILGQLGGEIARKLSAMPNGETVIGLARNSAKAQGLGIEVCARSSTQAFNSVEEGTAFSVVVQSNRQTEADVRASGLDYATGATEPISNRT